MGYSRWVKNQMIILSILSSIKKFVFQLITKKSEKQTTEDDNVDITVKFSLYWNGTENIKHRSVCFCLSQAL